MVPDAFVLVNARNDGHEGENVMLKTFSVVLMHSEIDDDESFHVSFPRDLGVSPPPRMAFGGGGGGGGDGGDGLTLVIANGIFDAVFGGGKEQTVRRMRRS